MKIAAVLIFAFWMSPVLAANMLPLLSKIMRPGLVPPPRVSTECRIYSDKIMLIKTVGTVSVTTENPITLGGDVATLLTQATAGKIVATAGPMDASTVYYYGYPAAVSGTENPLELKITGSSEAYNDSQAAHTLVVLLDANCGN